VIRARRLLGIVAPGVAALSIAASTSPAASPELGPALGQALAAQDVNPTRTAALAVDLETGDVVFRKNASRPLLPASAEKLAVSLVALRILGPDFRFRTEVVATGARRGRAWHGNVFVVGNGDPTFAIADLDRLARRIAKTGVRRVAGRVLGDESHFDALREAPGWKPSYLGLESRPLSALAVVDLPVRTAHGSAKVAAHAFTAALIRRGVVVSGPPGRGRAPEGAAPLGRDASEPLRIVVRRMNRDSDNFVAEMVLKELGSTIVGRGSTAAGALVVREELGAAGVPLRGVRIADGSGLSELDRLTAEALVAILRTGASDPTMSDAFITSLAVAGISGTMKNRLAKRPTKSRVIAKTGTTNAASSLAGFIRRRYVFAIIQNGSPVPYWSARAAQDRFATVLARL
jgi:D-alanyl-D-alanine carboxypeptidase/D-alanyl-D-alanine-endopeptidase (penicillin-binding protein 4)